MSEAKEDVSILSHEACHEQLARLRVLLKESADRLEDQAESYYYLCETTRNAPDAAQLTLMPLIGGAAANYVASWRELIGVAKRADKVLDQMAQTAEMERQLRELEETTA